MLGKLFKYEIKATARLFFPLYGALLIFAIVNRFLLGLSDKGINEIKGIPSTIGMTLFMMTIAAIFAMTFIVMIQRFYKNLLGDEGYLMFTLPVRPWQHILTKMSVSIVWLIISGIVTIIALFLMIASMEFIWEFSYRLKELILLFHKEFGIDGYAMGVETVLLLLISLAGGVLMVYLSLAIGHMFSRHKLLASIGAFVGIQTLGNVAGVKIMEFISNFIEMENLKLYDSVSTYHGLIWIFIAIGLVFCAIYFFLTNYILNRKLNLE